MHERISSAQACENQEGETFLENPGKLTITTSKKKEQQI